MSGYGAFSYFYDRLTQNVDYSAVADAVESYIERFGGRRGILLDLACGTGSLCEQLARRGFDVIGTDASPDMLNAALDKKYDSGLPIQYLCQDMTKLDMYGTIDVTVCTLDSLNHLQSLEELKKAFERVSLFAFPDGMFIFDVNTAYKHREVLAQNAFTYDLEGLFCAWQNQYNEEDGSVDIFLDIFEQNGQGSYDRFSESFTERLFARRDILRLLEETGFELLAEYDGYTDRPPQEKSERVVFVARKRSEEDIPSAERINR